MVATILQTVFFIPDNINCEWPVFKFTVPLPTDITKYSYNITCDIYKFKQSHNRHVFHLHRIKHYT